ncbi:SDR family oxidoreductase [Myxococcus sp. K38C18041901]|uniref:type I polyketide synthase n=2 Tax=Myxococcus TaxID=32 RepID=UPI0020A837B1|nr:type I polyketide synthase [Myxococcus guangdongensis]MCP3057830.1 SDR family oxidoreductase [Myxococcus guangdongensis]
MGYFAVPYDIHFDDTMAYGSHHFLTNFKFQCAGREHLLFSPHFFEVPEFRRDFDRVLLLTYEGYSRNLSPANLGDRLVVLTTFEDRGEVGVRFCFRTLKRDGTPVACGYQTVLCADRATGALCAFPDSFRPCFEALANMFEPASARSFRERVLKGGSAIQELFSEPVRGLARRLLEDPASLGTSRLVDLEAASTSAPVTTEPARSPVLQLPTGATAFLFAGQGSFEPELFVRLKSLQPELRDELMSVVDVARGHGFDVRPLVEARDAAEVRHALAQVPQLDQLGIFLSGVLGARWLMREGRAPDVFVGHSFGEIAAMTAAGAMDLRSGAEVVCLRVRALEVVPEDLGTLAAVALGEADTARALVESGVTGVTVAGRNHAKQTVVAGARWELERLRAHLEQRGQGFTFVASRYPFHHPGLRPAAEAFRVALSRVAMKTPRGLIYSPIERRVYAGAPGELAEALAAHLLKPFDFLGAVERLSSAGCTRFLDCGTEGRMARIVQRIPVPMGTLDVRAISTLLPPRAEPVASVPVKTQGPEEDATIAIVSLGCMLPGGAKDPESFWRNIRQGISGIVDPGVREPSLVTDFIGPVGTPDRAYTLLTGAVRDEDLVAPKGTDPERFRRYVREQKLLAIALAQSMEGLGARAPERIQCLLGSTAEGSSEYDAALSLEAGEALLRAKGMHGADVALLSRATREVMGVEARSSELAPHPTLQAVVTDVVGRGVSTVLLDAACASSLYAIALGMKTLQRGEADLVLAGGVFSPGPGNNCLFSQFNGLSATGSRPFDASADGVIFGEGAGVVGLMRLSDALARGLPVRAIIRGTGLSSDGRSSSANVPRVEGQVAAMTACYAAADVDPASIQYLEAHGTATPAGDATELKSIGRVFTGKRAGIQLASVKALIGHVGWAAGAASVIKLCKALEHRLFPRQSNFERPGEALRALGADFEVSQREQPWPENGANPRRAATNGFGFGGTNAHLVLEEYRGDASPVSTRSKPMSELVVVAAEGVYPDARGTPRVGVPSEVGARFDVGAFRLPSSLRLLPDIAEDMDLTQGLALTAASALVEKLGGFDGMRSGTAIVLGLEGKTRRGVEAIQRVLAASTRRGLRELVLNTPERAALLPLAEALHDTVRGSVRPSGPYTLQGMMANVTPGRVAGALDTKGPNFVIDAGGASLAEALKAARDVLETGFELVLVGSANVLRPGAADDASGSEGTMLLAVTTAEKAAQRGLKVMCGLRLSSSGPAREEAVTRLPAHSAGEGLEVLRAVHAASEGRSGTLSFHPEAAKGTRLSLELISTGARATEARAPVLENPRVDVASHEASTSTGKTVHPATATASSTMSEAVPKAQAGRAVGAGVDAPASSGRADAGSTEASAPQAEASGFDLSASIGYHAPVLVEHPARVTRPEVLTGRRVLFIAGDETLAHALEAQARRLRVSDHLILFAGPTSTKGRVRGIDLSSEETAEASLEALGFEPQLILAVASIHSGDAPRVVEETALRHEALELLFLTARRSYEKLVAGDVELASLCVGGLGPRRVLHPVTGLFAGMLKSIAREVPARNVRAISTTSTLLSESLDQALVELGSEEGDENPSVEVCFDGETRCVRRLRPTTTPSSGPALLDSGSVVLLTGGGRGVTAVLAGALLKRYGCTVVLLGRSDPEAAPERILVATDEELPTLEREFYAQELATKWGVRMPELRARFERHLAARELRSTLMGLARLPGRTVYRVADVTRPQDVAKVMDELVRDFGRLDLVVHGAGTQTSKKLHRRRLAELRTNLDTKLLGLNHLHAACASRFGRTVPFHVLTSAFSFIGNDGQADYGAANEALDRLCAWVDDVNPRAHWCSVGWLAWDGIGMTRGSEYRVLGASRKLRGIRAEEGEALFLQLVEGPPREPINVQLTQNEREFYGLRILPEAPEGGTAPRPIVREVRVDAASVPCLEDHLVRGTPTLPGAWALDLMLRAALGGRLPELSIVTIEDVRFSRFIRVRPGGHQSLRAECTPLVDEPGLHGVQVRLLGDIVHASGVVLERDLVYAEARFTLTRKPPRSVPGLDAAAPSGHGILAQDPHCAPGGPIELRKMFDCLEDIRLEPAARFAKLGLPSRREEAGATVPALVLDAALRLSAMHVHGVSNDVFAPIQFQRATFDRELVNGGGSAPLQLSLKALRPRLEGDVLQCGTVAAVDEAGRLRMLLEGGLARPMA